MTTIRLKSFGFLVAGVFFTLLITLAPSGNTALAQACDTSGTRDGTAVPNVVPPNTPVTFTAINFTAGEEVSWWFTLPDGNVFGTARPLCCADETGTVRFEPLVMPDEFYQFPGRWAMTVQGATSRHVSVMYFCLVTAVQPTEPPATNTPVPATNTPVPVPATNTPAPPTATSVPPTVEATATSAITATVEVSPTVLATVEASPTTAVTVVAVPPTVEVLPTTPPVMIPTVEVTPVTPGMPTTGGSASSPGDVVLYAAAALVALSMLVLGFLARRKALARR